MSNPATKVEVQEPSAQQALRTNFTLTVTAKDDAGAVAAPLDQSRQITLRVKTGNVNIVAGGGTGIILANTTSVNITLQLSGKAQTGVVLEAVVEGSFLQSDETNPFETLAGPPYKFVFKDPIPDKVIAGVLQTSVIQLKDQDDNLTLALANYSCAFVSLTTQVYGNGIASFNTTFLINTSSLSVNWTATITAHRNTIAFNRNSGGVINIQQVQSNAFDVVPNIPTKLVLVSIGTNGTLGAVLHATLQDANSNTAFAVAATTIQLLNNATGNQNGLTGTLQVTIPAGMSTAVFRSVKVPGTAAIAVKAHRTLGDNPVADSATISVLATTPLTTLAARRVFLGVDPSDEIFGRIQTRGDGTDDFMQAGLDASDEVYLQKKVSQITIGDMYNLSGNTINASDKFLAVEWINTSTNVTGGQFNFWSGRTSIICVTCRSLVNPDQEMPADFDIDFKIVAVTRNISQVKWFSSDQLLNATLPTGRIDKGKSRCIVQLTPSLPDLAGLTNVKLTLIAAQLNAFDIQSYARAANFEYYLTSPSSAFYNRVSNLLGPSPQIIAYQSTSNTAGYRINSAGYFSVDPFGAVPGAPANSWPILSKDDPGSPFSVAPLGGIRTAYIGGPLIPGGHAYGVSALGCFIYAPATKRYGYFTDPPVAEIREQLAFSQAGRVMDLIEVEALDYPKLGNLVGAPAGATTGARANAANGSTDSRIDGPNISIAGASQFTITGIVPAKNGAGLNGSVGLTNATNLGQIGASFGSRVDILYRKFAVTGLNYDAARKVLVGTGNPFADWNGDTQYQVNVKAGTNVTLGRAQTAGKLNSNEIQLQTDISTPPGTSVADHSIQISLLRAPFLGIRFTALPTRGTFIHFGDLLNFTIELYDIETGLAAVAPEDIPIQLYYQNGSVGINVMRGTNARKVLAAGSSTLVMNNVYVDRPSNPPSLTTFFNGCLVNTQSQNFGSSGFIVNLLPLQCYFRAEANTTEWKYLRALSDIVFPGGSFPGRTHVYCFRKNPADADILDVGTGDRAFLYVEEDPNDPQGEMIYGLKPSKYGAESWVAGMIRLTLAGGANDFANLNGTFDVNASSSLMYFLKHGDADVWLLSWDGVGKGVSFSCFGLGHQIVASYTNPRAGTGIGPQGAWVVNAAGSFGVGQKPTLNVSLL